MYDIWVSMYWKWLANMNIPIRYICSFPYLILERPGLFYESAIIYFEPQDILSFIFY